MEEDCEIGGKEEIVHSEKAFISKYHKMLLISHFDKTVMTIGFFYYQRSTTNRQMDQESKYCGK